MINRIAIENFKSIESLTIELGRITVLVGANGSGKSNILEAIALGSAAAEDKLDNEFLNSRGIRVTRDSQSMKSRFDSEHPQLPIYVTFEGDAGLKYEFRLQKSAETPYSPWTDTGTKIDPKFGNLEKTVKEYLDGQKLYSDTVARDLQTSLTRERSREEKFSDFVIFSPDIAALRRLSNEGEIQPLGRKGHGLAQLLSVLAAPKNKKILADIKEALRMFDWFDDFEIQSRTPLLEDDTLLIKDRYLDSAADEIDQQSTNEGFLFVLFYLCLFASKETPSFFAVDNIDVSLNPKLCRMLMEILTRLAIGRKKQVVLTTHNPALLDGLDLNDKRIFLYAVSRNIVGQTKITRIEKAKKIRGKESVPLSEAFLRGWLGGLPRNF